MQIADLPEVIRRCVCHPAGVTTDEGDVMFGHVEIRPGILHVWLHGDPATLAARRFELVRRGRSYIRRLREGARMVASTFDPAVPGAIRLGAALGLKSTGIATPDGHRVMAVLGGH